MTQPPTPGQPFPEPSASSAPGTYNAQPYPPAAPSAPQAPYQGGQPYQPGQYAPQAGYAPQGQFQPAGPVAPAGPKPDSLLTNLFDSSRGFVRRYGNLLFIVAFVALTLDWLYGFYTTGSVYGSVEFSGTTASRSFNWGRAFMDTVVSLPQVLLHIGLVRLFIELVSRTAPAQDEAPASVPTQA